MMIEEATFVDDVSREPTPEPADVENWDYEAPQFATGLKGSIGDRSNHSNFSHQNSVKILSEFRKISQNSSEIQKI